MTAQRYVVSDTTFTSGFSSAFYQQDDTHLNTVRISRRDLQIKQMLLLPPFFPALSPIGHVFDVIGLHLFSLLSQMTYREGRAIWSLIDSVPGHMKPLFLVFCFLCLFLHLEAQFQQSAYSLGRSPVGSYSRVGVRGDTEHVASLGGAKVGMYHRRVQYPEWRYPEWRYPEWRYPEWRYPDWRYPVVRPLVYPVRYPSVVVVTPSPQVKPVRPVRPVRPVKPVVTRPKPVVTRPKPVVTRPRPVVTRPRPVITRPQLIVAKPDTKKINRPNPVEGRNAGLLGLGLLGGLLGGGGGGGGGLLGGSGLLG
ncbi:hypothetical protein TNCV_91431 [Trichonephila clavipes]|nr:hypothetical protein TNCV_91431 [Trichonephila clavipes]